MKSSEIRQLMNLLLDTLLPRRCAVCEERLKTNERGICVTCLNQLPFIKQDNVLSNTTTKHFWGKEKIEKGYSLLQYIRLSDSQHIFSKMKYQGNTDLCQQMGLILASNAKSLGLFEEIDVIVPVPLHDKRQEERGYNQSEYIAKGISQLTGLPIDTNVIRRIRYTHKQASLNAKKREENVKGAFAADPAHASKYKNILVVDDTITTGCTVLEVLKELHRAAPTCKLSVCSIGLVTSNVTDNF